MGMVPEWIGEGMAEAPLRDLLSDARQVTERILCRSCLLLKDLEGDDRAALSEALGSEKVSAGVIARALEGYGVKISPSAISRHRRECGPIQ